MRNFVPAFAALLAAVGWLASARLQAEQPITPLVELQSGALTPGLTLDESPRPVHQIRLIVDVKLDRGTLILDGNRPQFDEFGELVGGIQTPHVRANGKATLILEFGCTIEVINQKPDGWRLFRLRGPKLTTPLNVAARGSLADGGPARMIVLGPDDKAKAVVECTRYGLVVP